MRSSFDNQRRMLEKYVGNQWKYLVGNILFGTFYKEGCMYDINSFITEWEGVCHKEFAVRED